MNADPWAGHRKVLAVADVQTGYHHGVISHALTTVATLGRRHGAFRTELRTDSQLITGAPIVGVGPKYGGKPVNARDLSHFDALFLMPSGAGTLRPDQQADLLAWIRAGGGLVVGHAALFAYFDWPEWAPLVGGRVRGEFTASAPVRVRRPTFPGLAGFGELPGFGAADFEFTEQHPLVGPPFDPATCQVVLELASAGVPEAARARVPEDHFPVLWTRREGRGRVCNLTWGHEEHTWDDPRFQALLLGALTWAMGDGP
ncbi:MAG: ThuA domain-containing protein [Myxococcales bacterium]|nr:ThuA domain-containing protein [Myxococcales bacterium]